MTRGDRAVLAGIDVTLPAAAITCVTGPTGAGKSTLLHLLGGLLRPTTGTVFAGADPVSRWTAGHRDAWRKRVGIALQAPHLLDGLTALENVLVPLVPRGLGTDDLRSRGTGALDRLGVAALAGASVGRLSGGERQRVSLARSLVAAPAWLLWDEPTAHQDTEGVARILEVLDAERARGCTIVVASHDPRLADAGLADLVLSLAEGHLR